MARVARALLRKPRYLSCVLQSSAAYSMFVVFISLAPYVMVTALGRSATEYGLYYPFIAVRLRARQLGASAGSRRAASTG